ncbi:MAG: DUF2605 domain-containing protein [Nodosilinea sp.]
MPPAPQSEDPTLLTVVLKPLLDDFQYWFEQSLQSLGEGTIAFLTPDQQATLVDRVQTALAETRTAATLLAATDGKVGVDPAQMMAWHVLVAECWAIARRRRAQSS